MCRPQLWLVAMVIALGATIFTTATAVVGGVISGDCRCRAFESNRSPKTKNQTKTHRRRYVLRRCIMYHVFRRRLYPQISAITPKRMYCSIYDGWTLRHGVMMATRTFRQTLTDGSQETTLNKQTERNMLEYLILS